MITPQTEAQALLDLYYINSPEEINLSRIADGELLIIKEDDLDGCLGKIVFMKECGIITIDNKMKNLGQKRFTLAHEFGHYFLEGKSGKTYKYSCSECDINSYKSSKIVEQNANEFAGELLMPEMCFKKFIGKNDLTIDALILLSQKFSVSPLQLGMPKLVKLQLQ